MCLTGGVFQPEQLREHLQELIRPRVRLCRVSRSRDSDWVAPVNCRHCHFWSGSPGFYFADCRKDFRIEAESGRHICTVEVCQDDERVPVSAFVNAAEYIWRPGF